MTKYEKIYNEITSDINNAKIKIGESLASENELRQRFDSSRATVRRALTMLEDDGIIIKQQGKESIVINNTIKSKTVLLILPTLYKYIFKDIIDAIEVTLRENKVNLLIACSYNDQEIEREIIRTHITTVDGIIIEPTQAHLANNSQKQSYNELIKMPTVCINAKMTNFNVPYLVLDDFGSAQKLAVHVKSLGCKKILIVAKVDDFQGHERLLGMKSQFIDDLSIEYNTLAFTTHEEDLLFQEFAIIYQTLKPDCIMFYNDEYAYRLLNHHHMSPKKLGITITGFDDTDYSSGSPFNFISPSHPKARMGRDAAHAIIKLMQHQNFHSITYKPLINFDK